LKASVARQLSAPLSQVRWLCDGLHAYGDDHAAALERAFQRVRLFPSDGAPVASVAIRRGDVAYSVCVRRDGEGMTQRRLDSGAERPVTRVVPAAVGAAAVAAVELPDCASLALGRATEHARRESEAAVPALLEAVRRGERDYQLQLQRAATQAAEELKKAQAQVAEAQTQAARAASDAERQLAARLKQEAAQRMADAARLKQEADIRVSDVKREAARTEADVRRTMEFFARAAALHMNIDPFKSIDGQPLLELYCDDAEGRYRTLFETGTGGGR
jgi:F0F1-type ATP synthase membrane subunit b/b'